MDILYTASATAVGGRAGHVRSPDGVLDLPLAHPKELGGPGGAATNPEQIFVTGYAACLENALLRVARERKAPIRESSVTAHVGIGRGADGFFRLRAALEISGPGRDRAEIEEFAHIAHEEVCPYWRATRGNIEVELRVVRPGTAPPRAQDATASLKGPPRRGASPPDVRAGAAVSATSASERRREAVPRPDGGAKPPGP